MLVREMSGSFIKTNTGGTAGDDSLLSQKTWDKGLFVFPKPKTCSRQTNSCVKPAEFGKEKRT
jgi:hypothetical protein